jgi:hypothetical protein
MSTDLIESFDRDTRAMERLATAFEAIALTLAQFYDKMYPPKHEPRDVTLTRIPTEEDKIREAQGSTQETTDQWLDIGPRERALLENPPAKKTRRAPRRVTPAGSVSPIKS